LKLFQNKQINEIKQQIISKLFQCIILHITTSETETKLFQPPKEFWNYFKFILATLNMLAKFKSCN